MIRVAGSSSDTQLLDIIRVSYCPATSGHDERWQICMSAGTPLFRNKEILYISPSHPGPSFANRQGISEVC